ncbi:MAG: GIY-YIG nuclease family protein [Proteobacteria bacterium]|nr:GIY-YIG nuclease family protein [Pseudomonadota bacterium]
MRKIRPAVYMEANRPHGTVYTGTTGNLPRRHQQHSSGTGSTFTRQYNVKMLVWYELHPTMESAILREGALKNLPRARKIRLIQAMNPTWQNLESHLQDF